MKKRMCLLLALATMVGLVGWVLSGQAVITGTAIAQEIKKDDVEGSPDALLVDKRSLSVVAIGSLVASAVSVCIGLLAIGLSVVFYRMSSQLSQNTREAAKDISASLVQLEKIFDMLYSDTFSMMKDTVSDMRRHIWSKITEEDSQIDEEAEKRADERISELREGFDKELAQILEKQNLTDEKIEHTEEQLRSVLDRAISETRRIETEVRPSEIRPNIIRIIRAESEPLAAVELTMKLERLGYELRDILPEISIMKEEGILFWHTESLRPSTVITIKG